MPHILDLQDGGIWRGNNPYLSWNKNGVVSGGTLIFLSIATYGIYSRFFPFCPPGRMQRTTTIRYDYKIAQWIPFHIFHLFIIKDWKHEGGFIVLSYNHTWLLLFAVSFLEDQMWRIGINLHRLQYLKILNSPINNAIFIPWHHFR